MADVPISPELVLVDPELARLAIRKSPVIDPLDPQKPSNANGAQAGTAVETLLFGAGVITADQLGELVRDAVLSARPVAAVALERGLVTVQTLQTLLAQADPPITLDVVLGAVEDVSAPPAPPAPGPPDAPPIAAPASAPDPVTPAAEAAPPLAAVREDAVVTVLPTMRPVAEPAPEPAVALEAEPPAPEPVEPSPAAAEETAFTLLLHLQNGDRLPVDHAPTHDAAAELARTISHRFATTTEWPLVAGRCVRPDAVVSVDIERALEP